MTPEEIVALREKALAWKAITHAPALEHMTPEELKAVPSYVFEFLATQIPTAYIKDGVITPAP